MLHCMVTGSYDSYNVGMLLGLHICGLNMFQLYCVTLNSSYNIITARIP